MWENEQEKAYGGTSYEYVTMTQLFSSSKYANFTERSIVNRTASERENLLRARELIDTMKDLYDIFGSPTLIHMKFAKLQIYAIKRLNFLIYNPEHYNSEGASRNFQYQGQIWNDSLPSDPELLSSIFCHILDIAYYGSLPKATVSDFK